MNILYYTWDEVTALDTIDVLRRMGHGVEIFRFEMKDYTNDSEFVKAFQRKLDEVQCDIVFTFNFFPIISKVLFLRKLPYVAWLFDARLLTLYSQMIFSPYNYIFSFDRSDCFLLKKWGVKNVWHLPLGVHYDRVSILAKSACEERLSGNDISFLGTLYNNQYDFFDQIAGLPAYLKGYADGVVAAELMLFAGSVIGELVDGSMVSELKKYATVECPPEYMYTEKDIFVQMLEKKATVRERREILELLSRHFRVTLYTNSDSSMLPHVDNRGYADYNTQMPQVFYHSKINLNITLRRIHSGISLRAMDIMAAGGFLLSDYQPELAEFFEDGKEVVLYHSRKDLLEKAEYYLTHEDERMVIAENGQKKVKKNFKYEDQFAYIFEMVKTGEVTGRYEQGCI